MLCQFQEPYLGGMIISVSPGLIGRLARKRLAARSAATLVSYA